jgi:hypothetical protein
MSTPSTALALWDHGRLALRPTDRAWLYLREHALEAALLAASAVVFVLFVAVLEGDVHRGEARQAEQHARAVAEVECEASRPAGTRAGCLALLDGAPAAVAVAADVPPNTAYAGAAMTMAAVGGGAQ